MKTSESPQMMEAKREAEELRHAVGPYSRFIHARRFFTALKAAIKGDEPAKPPADDKKEK